MEDLFLIWFSNQWNWAFKSLTDFIEDLFLIFNKVGGCWSWLIQHPQSNFLFLIQLSVPTWWIKLAFCSSVSNMEAEVGVASARDPNWVELGSSADENWGSKQRRLWGFIMYMM